MELVLLCWFFNLCWLLHYSRESFEFGRQ